MTTNKAAEALRDALVKAYQVDAVGTFIYDDPTLTDRLSAIIAEATAPLEADMAELRRAIAMTTQAFEAEVARLREEMEALATEWESGENDRDMGSEGRYVLAVTARRIRLALQRALASAATPAPPAPGESDDPPLGWPVWRAWFEGMEAQGRYVAPERRSWDTLPEQDRDLDAGIETRVAYFLSKRKVSQPAPDERCAYIDAEGIGCGCLRDHPIHRHHHFQPEPAPTNKEENHA